MPYAYVKDREASATGKSSSPMVGEALEQGQMEETTSISTESGMLLTSRRARYLARKDTIRAPIDGYTLK